jgi:dihydrofolate reductase
MIISQIAAMSKNRVIGKDNKLPWHMPDDLAYFFRTTRGRHIIMGRKNFEANGQALPDRINIVVTRQARYNAPGCIVVPGIDEALDYARKNGETEAFIVGGGEIYEASMPETERIYLTIIDVELEGDVFFPELDEEEWKVVREEKHGADTKNPYDFTYFVYERKKKH